MIEYAAFGWATLTWWTWPALVVTVVGSVYAAWYLTLWQERREEARKEAGHGPFPCLRLVAHDRHGRPRWCFERDDHVGPCRDLDWISAEEHAALNRLPYNG